MSSMNVVPIYPIISASGSLNISKLLNIYYFTPTTTGVVYTYTLPSINCDGMTFKIIRNDSDTTSTLNVTSTDNMYYGGTLSMNISVGINTVLTFISHDFIWYIIQRKSQISSVGKSLFSGNFISNSSTFYQVFSGGTNIFSAITTSGTASGEIISSGVFLLFFVGGSPIATITLRDITGATIIATTPSTSVSADTLINFSTVFQNLLPSTPSLLSLYINVSGGGGNKVGLSSFVLS